MNKILTTQYKKTFWVAIFVGTMCIAMYLFGVSQSVFNTVALKDAEIETSRLQSKLATLESQYILLNKTIDKKLASDLGFEIVHTSHFSFAGLSSSVSARTQ